MRLATKQEQEKCVESRKAILANLAGKDLELAKQLFCDSDGNVIAPTYIDSVFRERLWEKIWGLW